MEVWKDVVGFEQYYEVSNMGNVRSKERIQAFPFDETKIGIVKSKMMKQTPNSRGYYRVSLSDRKKTKQFFVHRLVAQAFVENPQNLPVVNHLDFDYTNNRAENLEWTTNKGNMEYSAKRGRFIHTEEWSMKIKKTLDMVMGKSVIGINIKTGESIRFNALNDCKKYGFQPSCVSNCCNGKRQNHKGFTWRFANAL